VLIVCMFFPNACWADGTPQAPSMDLTKKSLNLSPPHLSRSVHGVPLEKWIQKDSHRGKLNMLTDGAYFWEVSENDIGAIRRELSLAGIIFDWKKHL
jgi:hypothetical protein